MKLIAGYLLALVAVANACAGSCVTPTRFTYTHHVPHYPIVSYHESAKKAVVEEFKITYFVPAILAFPGYGGSYIPPVGNAATPPASASPSSSPGGELQQILTAIKQVDSNVRSIDDRVRALEAKVNAGASPIPSDAPAPSQKPNRPDPFAKPQPNKTGAVGTPHTVQSIFQARCASCHADGTAAELGRNFVMFKDGKMMEFSDKQWRKIGTKLTTKQMPPEKDAKGNPIPELPQDEFEVVMKHMASLN